MRSNSGGSASDDGSTGARNTARTQVAQRHYDPAGDAELTTTVVFAIADAMSPRAR